ncbi:MAG: recombinase family protein [Geitlerinemataceae cyanobacterium]
MLLRWIEGATRSGKTQRLIEAIAQQVEAWSASGLPQIPIDVPSPLRVVQSAPPLLILAANGDNRAVLGDRLGQVLQGRHPTEMTTPLGFFEREVLLFWPRIAGKRNLKVAFPLRLQSETEQELARSLWADELADGALAQPGVAPDRQARRVLDLLQLATAGCWKLEDIAARLDRGLPDYLACPALAIQEAAAQWFRWTLDRGLLTYGTIFRLYREDLLADEFYRAKLLDRFSGIYADDIDEYPAICRELFEIFAQANKLGALTFNADRFEVDGELVVESTSVRRGINADPDALRKVRDWVDDENCEWLDGWAGCAERLRSPVFGTVYDPLDFSSLPAQMLNLASVSRSQLLRATAETVADLIESPDNDLAAGDIAIIAPGLDAVSRYAIATILEGRNIRSRTLNTQRPLSGSPRVRALLTLVALVYCLGDLLDRDAVAEMLTMLSPRRRSSDTGARDLPPIALGQGELAAFSPDIDPVRAGAIADLCYVPDLENPDLQSLEIFPRRDRLGYRASAAYARILDWLKATRGELEAGKLDALAVLDRAVRDWLWRPHLNDDSFVELRAAIESSQHYWDVQRQIERFETDSQRDRKSEREIVGRFVRLLRSGAIAADPFPVGLASDDAGSAILLSNIFQYRSTRQTHRWQFWLDVGSPLWSQGGAAELFGAPLFLRSWDGETLDESFEQVSDDRRLRCVLAELMARAEEQIVLCHSDLDTSGAERLGPLLPLVDASAELARSALMPLG